MFYGSTGEPRRSSVPLVGIVPTARPRWVLARCVRWRRLQLRRHAVLRLDPRGLGLHPAGSGLPDSLNAPIVGMVPSSDDGGYFMVSSDGGVFAFSDARSAGLVPGHRWLFGLRGCGHARPTAGNGYWVGDLRRATSTHSAMPPTRRTRTWHRDLSGCHPRREGLLDPPGRRRSPQFGDAPSLGSPPSADFNGFDPAATILATADNQGYWVASAQGKIFPFGDAPTTGTCPAPISTVPSSPGAGT